MVSISANSWGQAPVDSTQIIPTIEVKAKKTRTGIVGSTVTRWESPQLSNTAATNIATLLQTEAGVFIKSYGLGSLATSSVRGGSAGHTLVLWNGIPIHSPMLGLLDLSLLSINAIDAVQFQKGGNGALWGSGAIGGVLSMDNEVDFSDKMNLSVRSLFGAFGISQQDLNIGLGNTKFQSKTRFSYRRADNDFTYRLRPQLPKQKQTNAALENYNFLQEF
ncbi:MAG: Plug domain-containing protein, partial [Bacteroidota bacterium]